MSTAVALKNLEVMEREDVLGNVRRNEPYFRAVLEKLGEKPIVGDVRGAGYFMSLELVRDKETKETFSDEECDRLLRGFLSPRLYDAGLICRADDRGDPVIQLSPPLIATRADLDYVHDVLDTVLDEAWAEMTEIRRPPGRDLLTSASVLTVADIVALDALRADAGAAAAPAPTGRCAGCTSRSSSDPTPWLRGGELLLTTGRPLRSGPAALRRAAGRRRGLTGLGLGLGFGFDETPAEAVARGRPARLPAVRRSPTTCRSSRSPRRCSPGSPTQRVAEAERRLAGDLVEAILAGDVGPRELRRRARAFGTAGDAADDVRAAAAGHGAAPPIWRGWPSTAGRLGPASVRDGVVAVLIEAARRRRGRGGRAADLLRETGAGAAGVGRVRTEPAELARSYDEALYAVEVRPGTAPRPSRRSATWARSSSCSRFGTSAASSSTASSMLGPLVAHDGRHGSALIESLRAYIEANGRWAEAAAALNVHRHTLRYRIRKIEQLTGPRSRPTPRDRLELWLALRAARSCRAAATWSRCGEQRRGGRRGRHHRAGHRGDAGGARRRRRDRGAST